MSPCDCDLFRACPRSTGRGLGGRVVGGTPFNVTFSFASGSGWESRANESLESRSMRGRGEPPSRYREVHSESSVRVSRGARKASLMMSGVSPFEGSGFRLERWMCRVFLNEPDIVSAVASWEEVDG